MISIRRAINKEISNLWDEIYKNRKNIKNLKDLRSRLNGGMRRKAKKKRNGKKPGPKPKKKRSAAVRKRMSRAMKKSWSDRKNGNS